jgi:hypothetical protein
VIKVFVLFFKNRGFSVDLCSTPENIRSDDYCLQWTLPLIMLCFLFDFFSIFIGFVFVVGPVGRHFRRPCVSHPSSRGHVSGVALALAIQDSRTLGSQDYGGCAYACARRRRSASHQNYAKWPLRMSLVYISFII